MADERLSPALREQAIAEALRIAAGGETRPGWSRTLALVLAETHGDEAIVSWIATQSSVSIRKQETGKTRVCGDDRSGQDRDLRKAFAGAMAPPPASISKDG